VAARSASFSNMERVMFRGFCDSAFIRKRVHLYIANRLGCILLKSASLL
jgi:hypothetical protein